MRPALALVAGALVCSLSVFAQSQPTSLLCKIEGSSFIDEMKIQHPGIDVLGFAVDTNRREAQVVSGLFAATPAKTTYWGEIAITLEQPYQVLLPAEGVFATRVFRIDRVSGRFSTTIEYRDEAGVHLADAVVKASGIIPARPGLETAGQCSPGTTRMF